MKRILLSYFILLFPFIGSAQTPTQNLRGKVLDKETQQPLPGVSILISPSNKGTTTDNEGNFRFEKLPIGRYSLTFSMIGYDKRTLPTLEIGSGKELILTIEMLESPQFLKEVVVKAELSKEKTLNDLAMVSGRQFTVQESNRYAGGYADPARMAMAFAGVTSAGNDQNNEIVIRGNSPKGLLWRLEGVEIPNPNHFGDGQGSTSGIISMINSGSLANSDFLTGAFPAEYGNATSGVFDLKLRRGNDQKHEFMGQLSVIGLEAAAEGPISKNGASYRLNFRYSTLELLLKSGLLAIETGGFKPAYRDMNFTMNFPTKKAGTFSLWGVGGLNFSDDNGATFQENERNKMGVTGLSHKISTGSKGYFYSVLSASTESNKSFQENLINNKNWVTTNQNLYAYKNLRFSTLYNYKINSRGTIRTGLIISRLGYELNEDRRDNTRNILVNYLTENDATYFIQAYTQAKYNLTQKLSVTGGVHFNHFLLNDNQTIEPRFGVRYQINEKHSLSAGYGLHSRLEPISLYLYKKRKTGDVFVQPNLNLGMTRAAHYIIGYDRNLGENTRLKIEAYYQKLFEVPVDSNRKNFFSMLNSSSGLTTTVLSNDGLGENQGLEITLERYFAKSYYFLLTGSLFESKFKARDNQWRNTVFNNTYAGNVLAGKEFPLGKQKQHFFVINSRLMWRGGNRYIPINLAESIKKNTTITDVTQAYIFRLPDYWRIDLGIAYKINKMGATWTLSADLQNVTNRKNEIQQRYNSTTKQLYYNYALPIVPILNFKVDF
jgi:CarboxypepD_reg-like domain/TonB-dependent Receptor Plug Domain